MFHSLLMCRNSVTHTVHKPSRALWKQTLNDLEDTLSPFAADFKRNSPASLSSTSISDSNSESRRRKSWVVAKNMSQTFKVTKKKKKDPSSRRIDRKSSSFPTNSLTVSAIWSGFFITGVPDWHKIDFSVTSQKPTCHTHPCYRTVQILL